MKATEQMNEEKICNLCYGKYSKSCYIFCDECYKLLLQLKQRSGYNTIKMMIEHIRVRLN